MVFTPSNNSAPPARRPSIIKAKRPIGPSSEEHRLNERIRVPQVRLIDEKGNQVGIVATQEALSMARSRGLDLMEVAPNSRPPVCKILDYGKFKYEKKKKDHAAKKKQTVVKIKEVQIRPNTETHDLEYKSRNIRAFLEEGDKAKISMLFRGREITHSDLGFKLMNELAQKMVDVSIVESRPAMEGRKLIMILAPVKKKSDVKASKTKPDEKAPATDKDKE